ncbi:hypothetical protein HG531_009796 [Fusarium graminearum]|nr:hypothetical protein HG531_009796 [Fusarium graminearum]
MHLLALTVVLPLFDGGVSASDEVFIGLDLVDLDSFALHTTRLGSQALDLSTVVLVGIDTLLLGTSQASPAELRSKDLLDFERDKHPERRQVQVNSNVVDKGFDDLGVLVAVAERITSDHGKLFTLNPADGSTGLMSPDLEALVEPRCVCGITIVGNELLQRRGRVGVVRLGGVSLGVRQARGLGGERLGIAVEERGVSNITKLKHPSDDTFKTKTSTSVRRSTQLKGSEVVLHTILGHTGFSHVGSELVDVVDTLATGADLLAADEDIERSSPRRVLGVLGSIERTGICGEFVENIVIGVVLLTNELAKSHLIRSRQILHFDFASVVTEHLKTLAKREDKGLLEPLELLAGPSLTNDLELSGSINGSENFLEEDVNERDDLVVVGINGHLQIETSVLSQVTVGVGVFGTEDRADLKDTAKVGRNGLLLGELGTLGKESPATKVVHGEDSGTTLCGSRLQLGGVDLNEAMFLKGVSEDSRNHCTHTEEGLVRGVSKIENSGVHAVAQSLRGLVVAERKVLGKVDEVDRVDGNLNSRMCGRSNRLRRLLQGTSDLDQRLRVDLADPRDKVGITGITGENTLNGVCLVTEEEEVEDFGDGSLRLDTGSECDFGAKG